MILYFLRHASAGESMSDPKKDKKRPIDPDGVKQSHNVGRALAALEVQPEMIISSPLTRATQTASLVANELGFEGKIQIESALTPEASYSDFVDMLRRSGATALPVMRIRVSRTAWRRPWFKAFARRSIAMAFSASCRDRGGSARTMRSFNCGVEPP